MVAHVARHHKRQVDPVAAPTGVAGIENSAIVVDDIPAATATGLVFDTAASTGATQTPPNFGVTTTPAVTIATATTPSPTDSPTPSVASAASSHTIPMSTVIGACVGALIGASALIILGLWFYRRYSRQLKHNARTRQLALGTSRNMHGDAGRRRSHLEPWNKLEESDDKWEGTYQAKDKEADNVAPMEKLTMFKKSTPSVRTAWTSKSQEEPVTFDLQPFVQYHPNLAQELAGSDEKTPIARQFLGRVDAGPAISWGDSVTVTDNSYLNIRSNRLTSGAMSPTLNMAIPTPAAQTSQLHRWESAEVIEYEDPDSSSSSNPFGVGSEQRKSASNPFFSAQDIGRSPSSKSGTRSRANSTRSRSNSTATVKPEDFGVPKLNINKGKDHAVEVVDDPFSDNAQDPFQSLPRNFATNHGQSGGSQSSVSSNDRALQSLIAALEVSEEEVQERLRVASMQPSFISGTSQYSIGSAGEEEDVTGSFPLPPSSDIGHPASIRR
ncbi:hypothetical protein DXG03_000482 [Asterophora parasitica]|uniref:Uncharacterized protein n=1 Tax=Asterophora parasitica TaxID=117018 RepID=A0A9P7KCY1_9AGAR|nr:hypothetical protein DXG03_000482 [Asterophora parasitica]